MPLACKLCAVALGGKGLVWCSSQLFGSVLLGSSESQTGSCRKSRAQSKIGASPAANKCFQFVASPPDAACGGAAEAGVMRPNQVGHFCRIVLICCWLGFASLSKAGEIAKCYLSLILCNASRRFSSLSGCQNSLCQVGTCNACSGICADLQVHTRSAW